MGPDRAPAGFREAIVGAAASPKPDHFLPAARRRIGS
jgi:hypothetical protein